MKLDLEALEAAEKAATAGPWFVHATDDDICANARYISAVPTDGHHDNGNINDVDPEMIIAITLHQRREGACVHPQWHENAKLIAIARNSLPSLLARLRAAEALKEKATDVYRILCVGNKPAPSIIQALGAAIMDIAAHAETLK